MNCKYKDNKIYYVDENENLMAELDYISLDPKTIEIEHVYVNPAYRGQGLADKIMLTAVEYLRKEHLQASASCSYAKSWFEKNEALYSDVISEKLKEQNMACKIDAKH